MHILWRNSRVYDALFHWTALVGNASKMLLVTSGECQRPDGQSNCQL